MDIEKKLSILYLFVPLSNYNMIICPYANVIIMTIIVYIVLLYLNSNEPKLYRQTKLLAISYYIHYIGICTSIMSLFISNIWVLLLIRYISWIFTFPHLLLIDNYYSKRDKKYNIVISINISILVFIFNIINHYYNEIYSLGFCWLASICFYIYYNFSLPTYSYINIIWIIYGIANLVYNLKVITIQQLYVYYTIFDILSKSFFTIIYQLLYVKPFSTYNVLQTFRVNSPIVQDGESNNIYNQLYNYIDLSPENISCLKNELIDELFPDKAWESLLSPVKNYKKYLHMGILFCDMVNYTTYVKNTPIETVISDVDKFYTKIDLIVIKNKVQKVETIGDAYMIVSENYINLLECAIDIIKEYKTLVRIGIHCGECVACTLGITKSRYGFVGHAVNVAARLQSTSIPGKIQISEELYKYYISNNISYPFEKITPIELKGIGEFQSYLINII